MRAIKYLDMLQNVEWMLNEYLSYFNPSYFLFTPSALPLMFVLSAYGRESAFTHPQVAGRFANPEIMPLSISNHTPYLPISGLNFPGGIYARLLTKADINKTVGPTTIRISKNLRKIARAFVNRSLIRTPINLNRCLRLHK